RRDRHYCFGLCQVLAEASATPIACLLTVLRGPSSVSAQQQHLEDPTASVTPSKNALEERLRGEMGCVCGTCAHEPLTKCTCGSAQRMRAELRAQIDQGKNHEEIIQAFIGLYGGQQFLQAPIDKGFNRVAWLFPYLLGATGVVAIGFAAIKWSRRGEAPPPDASPAIGDPALEERIDDELRDLD